MVLDEIRTAGGDGQSGFYYDSTTAGGIATSVWLGGGHEAVVKVTCETKVRIANHGRAWVDLKTSPQFYYQAPEIYWGRQYCFLLIV